MACFRQVSALCVLLSMTAGVAEASFLGKLRPYAARHHHAAAKAPAVEVAKHSKIAKKVQPETAPVPAATETPPMPAVVLPAMPAVAVPSMPVVTPAPPAAAMPPMDDDVTSPVVQVAPAVKPAAQPAALKQLQDDLVEVKQMHANVLAVEQTLAADVSLLRESATLQKMSSSPEARAAALQQVRQTERIVKDTEAMVVKSRENAVSRANLALREATEVQKAADALSAEARAQLKALKAKTVAKAEAPAVVAKPVDTEDDVADAAAASAVDDVAM